MSEDVITLCPYQSLALRRAIDAMKADGSIYSACPDIIRSALLDFLMPAYSSAELEIADLREQNEHCLKLLDRFGNKIKELEKVKKTS